MPSWFIPVFVLVDIIAMAIVVSVIVSKRGFVTAIAGMNLQQLRELSAEMERETDEYLRSNWSGDATTLPIALTALLDRFEAKVREKQLPITREQLKPLLGRVVASHRLAKFGDVREALKQVA